MNPIVAANLAQKAKKIVTNKYVVIAVVIVISIFILRGGIKKLIKKFRENQFDKNETKDVNQIAQQIRAASNPSGFNWMIDWDGTDEDTLTILAHQTKGAFKEVADAYRLKFAETLTDRIRKELDAKDYQNWINIVQ